MKKSIIVFTLLTLSLFVIPMISAKALEIVPDGILNKFENFKECFGGAEKSCHRFDYDKNGIVGLSDFGKFVQKYNKRVKLTHQI